jgi:hypothetical protein
MAKLEERHISGSKTALLIGGAVGLFILISYAVAVGSLYSGI